MKTPFYYIPKRFLLLIAGFVWAAAGINIVRIGVTATTRAWTLPGILAAVLVFALFFGLIFRKLIRKHTGRITGYKQKRLHILRFFDAKSYLIMIFMMTFGILLRRARIWPDACIRMFYTGLGSSLIAAGAGFFIKFLGFEKEEESRHKGSGVWI